MSVNSKQKGSRGERQACKFLKALEGVSIGKIEARRSQQFSGMKIDDNSADILTNIDCIRFEVKSGYNDTDLYNKQCQDWIETAIEETPEDKIWAILRKKDYQQWTIIAEVEGIVVQSTDVVAILNYLIEKYG